MEAADHYRQEREAATELLSGLGEEQLATVVPGCPKWTVKNVLAHLVGETASVCDGDMENAGSPEWTQKQVDARAGRSVGELLEEWGKRGVGFEAAMPEMGGLAWIFVMDICMHVDDVREALGQPLCSSATGALVLDRLVGQAKRKAEGVGSLQIRCGERSWDIGGGEPSAQLRVDDAGELGRVLGGRRTDDQVRALDWTGDPEPWLPVLPLFR